MIISSVVGPKSFYFVGQINQIDWNSELLLFFPFLVLYDQNHFILSVIKTKMIGTLNLFFFFSFFDIL